MPGEDRFRAGHWRRRVRCPCLQQNHGLKTCDFDALAASRIAATDDIVYPDHVITRILEASPVFFGRTGRKRCLLCALDPPDLVVGGLFARRAVQLVRVCFVLFSEEVSFVQNYSPFPEIPGIVIRMGSSISSSRFTGRIFFSRAISRTVLPVR